MVVLDTDHLSLLEKMNSPAGQRLRLRLETIPAAERAATIVSFEEQSRGWLAGVSRARTGQEFVEAFRRLQRHLHNYCSLTVLPFDGKAAEFFHRFRQLRLRIGTKDLQIAAIARSYDATVLSRNRADFSRVADLRVEDWTS